MKKYLPFLLLFLLLFSGCGKETLSPEPVVSGKIICQAQSETQVRILWNSVSGVDGYQVELADAGGELLFSLNTATNSCTAPVTSGTCTLSIACIFSGKVCSDRLTVTDNFSLPEIGTPEAVVNPLTGEMFLHFDLPEGLNCRLYRAGDMPTLLQIGKTGTLQEVLTDSGSFYLDAYRDTGSLLYYGLPTDTFHVEKPEEATLSLTVQEEPGNRYRLSWNSVDRCTYLVEQEANGVWEPVFTGSDTCFSTPRLTPNGSFRFRVTALWEGSPLLTSQEVTLNPGTNILYATIWPIVSLNVYADPGLTNSLGVLDALTPLCVLEAQDNWFRIRWGQSSGYILSDLCMVNLPEYLGELCRYDIVNSYDALYHIHGYAIADVTGTVCTAYENVRLWDGSFLVPYLYPSAQRLETAAKTALSQGYQLKIYDSYRPQETTIDLYNRANQLLSRSLPEGSGTYYSLMTQGGTYPLNCFLAPGGSRHNMGIALDLTLVYLSTGEDISAQSSMHDLSYYSLLAYNTPEASLLADIMKEAGFADLISEWWHFSDAAMLSRYTLPYCQGSVTAQGWVYDGTGWRYRETDGTFLQNVTAEIQGESWNFGGDGYIIS